MDDLCGTKQAPSEFFSVVQYIIGTSTEKRKIDPTKMVQQARQCFRQVLIRSNSGNNAFEAFNVGGEELLWWKGSFA